MDGIPDPSDNCVHVKNADQTDSDCDSYGNACDSDFNNDGAATAQDLSLWDEAQPYSFRVFDVAKPFNGIPDVPNDRAKVLADVQGVAPPGPTGLSGPSCTKNLGPIHYCIEGTGTGTDYSWSVFSDAGSATELVEPAAPAGSNAHLLMLNLMKALNVGLGWIPISVVDIEFREGLACFSLTDKSADLRVGAQTVMPSCLVTSATPYCQYNPSIYQVLGATTPALSIGGLIALASLLAGSCAFVLRRKHAARE